MDFGSLFEGEEAADSATEVAGEEQAGSDESEEPAVRPGVRRPTADEIALQQARDNAGLGEETPEVPATEVAKPAQNLPTIPARSEQLELDGDVTYTLPGMD